MLDPQGTDTWWERPLGKAIFTVTIRMSIADRETWQFYNVWVWWHILVLLFELDHVLNVLSLVLSTRSPWQRHFTKTGKIWKTQLKKHPKSRSSNIVLAFLYTSGKFAYSDIFCTASDSIEQSVSCKVGYHSKPRKSTTKQQKTWEIDGNWWKLKLIGSTVIQYQ